VILRCDDGYPERVTVASRGSFRYANPPVIHWGPGCGAERLDAELRRLDAERVFVITTRSVARNPELLPLLVERLGARCVGQFSGIGQHAPADSVAKAVSAAREARPDALLSFGGGSPIDATKAVAFALGTGLDLNDPSAASKAGGLDARDLLPHLSVPTTLSVAELSGLAGFTTTDSHEKVGLRAEGMTPAVVFYDASLTLPTPLDLWLSTGIRAVDHAVETLLSDKTQPFSSTLSLEALRRLRAGLLASRSEPTDLAARTECQLGAWLSFTLPGPAAGGLCHTLGKRIGSRHDIPHGVTSCLLLPHVMRYLRSRTSAAQASIAAALGVDTREMPLDQAACVAADAVYDLIAALGQPQHLSAYGLSEADLVAAAQPVASAEYPVEDLIGVYRAAW
jgi:maleylacetate reductase